MRGGESPAESEAGDPELPEEALFGGEVVEACYIGELAAAENFEGEFLGWRS